MLNWAFDSRLPQGVLLSSSEVPTTTTSSALHAASTRAWLFRFLARRFGFQVAEDLIQEALARALAGRTSVRNPKAFLAKVAIRVAFEEVRRRPEPRFAYVPPTTVPADAEVAVLLAQTIAALPEPIREVFVLSRFGGLSNVEIAQRCNLSVKRVEARLTEARRRCAALIQD
jgi:RNA polymerase sigma factor (sigma-70 family)